MSALFRYLGQLTLLTLEAARFLFTRRWEMREWMIQCYHLGVNSLSIACITATFTGMVLALQASFALSNFGAELYVSDLVSLSVVRELGPVITSLLVGGRIGAGITAELGSMRITQQLDAMRAMASSPVHKLVLPRLIASVTCLPALTVIANLLGIFGGLFVTTFELNVDSQFYLSRSIAALTVGDVVSGLGKTVFFGLFIGVIACNNGMRVEGGADGVGMATTRTVVSASIAILIGNFFLTKLFHVFGM